MSNEVSEVTFCNIHFHIRVDIQYSIVFMCTM